MYIKMFKVLIFYYTMFFYYTIKKTLRLLAAEFNLTNFSSVHKIYK